MDIDFFGRAWRREAKYLAYAGDDESILGYAIYDFVEGDARIVRFGIHRDHQSRGHGRNFIGHVLRHCLESASRVYCHVRVSNAAAIRMYVAAGMTRMRQAAEYYSDGEDAVAFQVVRPRTDPTIILTSNGCLPDKHWDAHLYEGMKCLYVKDAKINHSKGANHATKLIDQDCSWLQKRGVKVRVIDWRYCDELEGFLRRQICCGSQVVTHGRSRPALA